MAKRTEQSLQEMETILRWDESSDIAVFWTASAKVRREWESFGFPVQISGSGWRVEVPKSRVAYKPLKKV